MLSLTDAQPDAGIAPLAPDGERRASSGVVRGVVGSTSRLVATAGATGATALRQAAYVAASPSHAASLAGALTRDGFAAVRLLLTPADAASALKDGPGISRRVAWSRALSLNRIKRIAHAQDATVNDVLMAALAGALRHYLQDQGSPTREIQAMVPFNLRPLDQPVPRELGNRFGLLFLPLPVGVSGSYRRLTEVHKRMQELKDSRDGVVSYALLSATGLTPEPVERRIVDLFTGKGTAIVTNVPGPAEPVYVAGTPIRASLFWAPTSGHIGMSVSIFSYRGEVMVGLMVDAAHIPDPGKVVVQFERELRALGRLEPHGTGRPRATVRSGGAAATRSAKARVAAARSSRP